MQRIEEEELQSAGVRRVDHEPPWLPLATFAHGLGHATASPVWTTWIPLLGGLAHRGIPTKLEHLEYWTKLTNSSCCSVAERWLRAAPGEGLAVHLGDPDKNPYKHSTPQTLLERTRRSGGNKQENGGDVLSEVPVDELGWTELPGTEQLSEMTHGDGSGGDDGGGGGDGGDDGEPNWTNLYCYSLLNDAPRFPDLKKSDDDYWAGPILFAVQELASGASAPLQHPATYFLMICWSYSFTASFV